MLFHAAEASQKTLCNMLNFSWSFMSKLVQQTCLLKQNQFEVLVPLWELRKTQKTRYEAKLTFLREKREPIRKPKMTLGF